MAGLLFGPRRALLGTRDIATYADKVLGYNPYAYWPLWETSGGVAFDLSGNGFDGAYTGVTLADTLGPDGINFAPLFDGINDVVDVYSDAFRDGFPYDEGSFAGWMKVFNAGVWTDGSNRAPCSFARSSGGSNYIVKLRKQIINNRLNYLRDDGDDNEVEQNIDGQNTIVWASFVVTWSVISGNLKFYLAGSQMGASQAGVLAATNTLTVNYCTLGDQRNTAQAPWHGWLGHPAVFSSVLSDTAVADLAVV